MRAGDSNPVEMEFALEAKCYSPGVQGLPLTTVGVSATARLISRLRHRQFGILVTTSVVAKQAYAEIRRRVRSPINHSATRTLGAYSSCASPRWCGRAQIVRPLGNLLKCPMTS